MTNEARDSLFAATREVLTYEAIDPDPASWGASRRAAWEELGRIEKALRDEPTFEASLREVVDAVEAKLTTMNYYFGPQSRTAVGRESEDAWRRIRDAVKHGREVLGDA